MSSVFLSHSHSDKPFVRRLAADLRKAGHYVWVDEAEINIGDSLTGKIREGLDQVDYIAAVLSSASIGSQWVTRELDIATNREIQEGRVLVLPLLIEKVSLPGFLEGKFYGDFTDPILYNDSLKLLLRKLGPATQLQEVSDDEITRLKDELKQAQLVVSQYSSTLHAHQQLALRGKSKTLVAAIEKANKEHPSHAPINTTYAFEVMGQAITLDYLLWASARAERRGSHPLEALLEMDDKWGHVHSMLEAYSDLLKAAGDQTS